MNSTEQSNSNPPVIGAAPANTTDERTAAAAVRDMFSTIAPRYDLLNHLLSFNIDRFWWWRTARSFREILACDDTRVLDLCCGTGDMTFALKRRAGNSGAAFFGADFAHPMLRRALAKTRSQGVCWIEADALNLPLPDCNLHLVTSAFGFRNLANYDAGLREIYRVLVPGGQIGILDFGEPSGLIGNVYRIYFRHVLPAIGTVISGVRGPYAYLPTSVRRFPTPDEMLSRIRNVGFREVSWTPYTFGIAGLYRGTRP